MKRVWYFLVWQWNQFERWQKFWFLGMFFMGFGAAAQSGSMHEKVAFGISSVIFLSMFLHWVVVEGIGGQWRKFNREQDDIVDILKQPVPERKSK
jgi:hypothetical protein